MGVTIRDRLLATGKRFYCLCFTCRSGSTLLANDLATVGAGAPTEYFQFVDQKDLGGVADYIVTTVEHSPGRLFGFKIALNQMASLTDKLRLQREFSVTGDLDSVFPGLRYVHIVRQDKVAQAVSYWRAVRSGQWHVGRGEPVSLACPEYDYEAIRQALLAVVTEDWLWNSYFSFHGAPTCRVTYEHMQADRVATMQEVLRFLDCREPASLSALVDRTQVMRDEWSGRTVTRVWNDLRESAFAGLNLADGESRALKAAVPFS